MYDTEGQGQKSGKYPTLFELEKIVDRSRAKGPLVPVICTLSLALVDCCRHILKNGKKGESADAGEPINC